MWKKNFNFCHLLKIGSKQILPCQKISVFENECTHFNQNKEIYMKEDYQFCHLLKKFLHAKKFQFLKFENIFFQSKERNV